MHARLSQFDHAPHGGSRQFLRFRPSLSGKSLRLQPGKQNHCAFRENLRAFGHTMQFEKEIEIYNTRLDEFRKEHRLDWVVISGEQILGFFRRFEQAATAALSAFGEQPFLIRQIDAPQISLPYLVIEG